MVLLLFLLFSVTSLVAQTVKNLPAMQETMVRSLGWEDPLEKDLAAHSRILAWRIPWTEEPGGLQSMGSQRVGHNWLTNNNYCSQSSAPWILCVQPTYSREFPSKQVSLNLCGQAVFYFKNYSIFLVTIPNLLKSFKILKFVNTY